MKTLLLSICIFFTCAVSAQVEVYGRYTVNGNIDPIVNIFATKKISDKYKLTYFSLVQKNWAEGLIGVSYSPKNWLSVGLSAGVEVNPAIYRFGGSVWMGKGKNSLLAIGEKGDGRDNYFYKITLAHDLSDRFTIAARAQRFHGVGPVLTMNCKKIDSSIWIMPAHDFEFNVNRLMLGVAVKF